MERARMVSWGQRGGKCLTTDGREVSVSAALLQAEDIVGNILRRCTRKLGRKDTKREAARQETEDRVRENNKGEKSAEMATHKEQANKKTRKQMERGGLAAA